MNIYVENSLKPEFLNVFLKVYERSLDSEYRNGEIYIYIVLLMMMVMMIIIMMMIIEIIVVSLP